MERFTRRSASLFGAPTVWQGEIQMAPGVTAVSQDYTKNHKRDFAGASSYHTGFKPSGAIFTKFDRLGYSVMPFPAIKELRGPLLLEQLYPAPLDGFAEVAAPRRHDVLVPDQALSPVNIKAVDIEGRFGDAPFHFELFAVPHGMMFAPQGPSTIGFAVEFETPLFRAVGVFRQDDTDLQRGWLDRTRAILARIEDAQRREGGHDNRDHGEHAPTA